MFFLFHQLLKRAGKEAVGVGRAPAGDDGQASEVPRTETMGTGSEALPLAEVPRRRSWVMSRPLLRWRGTHLDNLRMLKAWWPPRKMRLDLWRLLPLLRCRRSDAGVCARLSFGLVRSVILATCILKPIYLTYTGSTSRRA
jgi:hypothetical protein